MEPWRSWTWSSSSSIENEEKDKEQTMRGPEQSLEEKKNLASSSEQTLSNRQCRICYAPEASGADPMLLLECTCKGDISYGHQSCVKKWFRKRFQRNGKLDCEVCRSPLGARVEKIIRSFITAEIVQHAPRLLLLLQIPPHDLDDLQVPLEIPGFYQLPSETRRSLEAFFERLEQEQRRGQRRRREAFETAAQLHSTAAAEDREPSEAVLQDEVDSDHLTSLLRLEDMLLNDFLELREVNIRPPFGPPVDRVFKAHPHPHIYTFDEAEGGEDMMNTHMRSVGFPEGPVVRVPILLSENRMHPSPVEVLLDEVSRQVVRVVHLYGEDMILLPNYMDSYFREVEEPLLMSPAESEIPGDVVDDVPIASPVRINPSSGGPDPVSAEEAARPTDSTPSRRLYTYGRFQMFQLLQ